MSSIFDEKKFLKNLIGEYKNKKLVLTGCLAPPIGGVAVFCERLLKLLDKECMTYYFIRYPSSYLRKLAHALKLSFLVLFKSYNILFFNESIGTQFLVLISLLSRLKNLKIILMIHNNYTLDKIKHEIPFVSRLVLVGDIIQKEMIKKNIHFPPQVIIQNAFIPPDIDRNSHKFNFEKALLSFFDERRPVLMSCASNMSFMDSIDVYGIDMCIDLTAFLKAHFPDIGFVFALNKISNEKYYKSLKEKINLSGISNNFYFLISDQQYYPLLNKSDLFIRATYSDGYGISIDEALHFGVPVLASDCCNRNERAVLFKNRDFNDMKNKALNILKKRTKNGPLYQNNQ